MCRILTPDVMVYRPWTSVGVFLAGGITGCPDWQSKFSTAIVNGTPEQVVVMNPRVPDLVMDPTDRDTTSVQIQWEYDALEDADVVVFWFPKESVCPISLFELGKELVRARSRTDNKLFIGVEPGYPRALDIELQVGLMFPDFQLHHDLDHLISDVVLNLNDNNVFQERPKYETK